MTPTQTTLSPSICICGDISCAIAYGYCHCGCGKETNISVIGKPREYLFGHHRKIRPKIEDAVPFKIDGVYCRLIPLTRGLHAIVDAADYVWLMKWKWLAMRNPSTGRFYAARYLSVKPQHCILMHREILGLDRLDPLTVDHIDNTATLDNRRKNLRLATELENSYSRLLNKNNKTGFKGVHWSERGGYFRAQISFNGKKITLGRRSTAEAAYKELYVPASIKYHGIFSKLE